MKFYNNDIRLNKLDGLLLVKENLNIFSLLILFTALSTILISFSFDLLIGNFNLLIEEDILLMTSDKNKMNTEIIYLYMKQELLNNNYNNKVFIFNYFMDLFNKSHSTYRYFPSYFLNFNPNYINIDHNLDYLREEATKNYEIFILKYKNNSLNSILNDLHVIVKDYINNNKINK